MSAPRSVQAPRRSGHVHSDSGGEAFRPGRGISTTAHRFKAPAGSMLQPARLRVRC